MTVEADNVVRLSYTGSGTTGPFTTPYFLANADIKVVQVLISDGTETVLTLTTDYTLTGAGEEDGGELTLVDSLSSSYQLVIINNAIDSQTAEYPRNDPFPSATHQAVVDRRTMVSQRHGDQIERAIRLPDGDTSGATMLLPGELDRASKYLVFDADGEIQVSEGTGTDSGLREDLASTSVAASGDALIGVKRTLSNAVAETLHRWNEGLVVSAFSFIPNDVVPHSTIRDGTNTTALTTYLQNAIDAIYLMTTGGTLEFPEGVFLSAQLTLKYRVSLRGRVPLNHSGYATLANIAGSYLKLADATNAPLLVNDQTNGQSAGTGIDGGTQRLQLSTIENMGFIGNRANQTTVDADLVRWTNAWSSTFRNCHFVDCKGFGLRALDCNILYLLENTFSGATAFLEHCADGKLRGNHMGGASSDFAYPVLWISHEGSWQNTIEGNYVFNNHGNVALSQPTFTSDSGGTSHILTTNATHGWTDKTPVVVTNSGGALPTGLSAGTTYYVKVLGATTVRLATSRSNVDAGTFVNVSGAGTGTHTIGVGENCNVYMNHGAKFNTINGNRFDQAYGHGVLLRESDENTFTANLVNFNGMGNVTAHSGFALRSATDNIFEGNYANGESITIGANSSNQTIGFDGDSNSTGNAIPGKQSFGHSSANVSMAAGYETDPKGEGIFIHVRSFGAIVGSPAIGLDSGNRREVFLLDAASTEIIGSWFEVPVGWTKFSVTLYWINGGAGSGNVVLQVSAKEFAATESINAADDLTALSGTIAAGSQNVLTASSFAGGTYNCTAGEFMNIRVTRVGGDGSDTLANDIGVVGLRLTRG